MDLKDYRDKYERKLFSVKVIMTNTRNVVCAMCIEQHQELAVYNFQLNSQLFFSQTSEYKAINIVEPPAIKYA